MRIVVLDGYALNPGDLSWAELQALGPCEIYDRTPMAETLQRSQDAEILLTNKTVLNDKAIDNLLGGADHDWFFAFTNNLQDLDLQDDR